MIDGSVVGSCAEDIGALDHVWAISCATTTGGFGIAVWTTQPALGNAPAKAEWKFVSGGATSVAVGGNGPWAVNASRIIFELKKTQ